MNEASATPMPSATDKLEASKFSASPSRNIIHQRTTPVIVWASIAAAAGALVVIGIWAAVSLFGFQSHASIDSAVAKSPPATEGTNPAVAATPAPETPKNVAAVKPPAVDTTKPVPKPMAESASRTPNADQSEPAKAAVIAEEPVPSTTDAAAKAEAPPPQIADAPHEEVDSAVTAAGKGADQTNSTTPDESEKSAALPAATQSDNKPAMPELAPPAQKQKGTAAKPSQRNLTSPVQLVFALKKDMNYRYDFEMNSGENGKGPWDVSGSSTYSLLPDVAQQQSVMDQAFTLKKHATATAFVVGTDGWLATCAHEVKDAISLQISLNDQSYPAKIIDKDEIHDVALLKIDAKGLNALPIGTKKAEQGDPVAVAGYPLSEILGNSIKITHGAVAGFVEHKRNKLIQIDASVNPGNSGGPLLNSDGEAIGLISNLLVGSEIDKVGFATDIAPLREMMKEHHVSNASGATERAPADSQSLEYLRQTIASLKVEIEVGKPKNQFQVSCVAGISSDKQQIPELMVNTYVSVSPNGELMSSDSQDLSLLFTSVGILPFDQLPPAGTTAWNGERQRTVSLMTPEQIRLPSTVPGNMSRYATLPLGRSPYSSLHFPPGAQTFFIQTETARIAIDDQFSYVLSELTADKAVVNTRLNSIWTTGPNGDTIGHAEGAGQYTFDRKQGVITSGCGEYKLLIGANGIERTVPFRLAFTLTKAMTKKESEEFRAKQNAESKARSSKYKSDQADRTKKAIATVIDPKATDEELRDALLKLSIAAPPSEGPEREQVAQSLNRLLKTSDAFTHTMVINVAARWATPTNIPVLMAALQNSDQSIEPTGIIEALGATGGNEKVALILARLMESSNNRSTIAHALSKMKKYAEQPVLPLLQSADRAVRDDACRILGDVGGKKSRDALEAYIKAAPGKEFEMFQAKDALRKIKARLAVQSD